MSSQFAELYEKSLQDLKEGEIVRGTVIDIQNRDVIVDISYKAEGVLSIDEFTDPSEVKIGMDVEVLFENFSDENGLVVLSKRKADRQRVWSELLENAVEGTIVDGKIYKVVRGGFMVDIGMDAFLPASLVDLKPTRNPNQFLGVTGKFIIMKINHKRKNIVVSRKDYLFREKAVARTEMLGNLQEGQVIKGKVKNITDFGVFIDLGDLDGLVHITDLSWGRISHPSEVVKLGEEIDVVVIGIDRDSGKVSLGLKQKTSNPWGNVEKKFAVGSQVHGKVVNILPYGAFVELEPGVEGLVHVSELSWTKRVSHPSEMLNMGDEVEVVILSIDQDGKKISLGIKQIQENPWVRVSERYQVGNHVKGIVRNLTDYGAFIELEPGVDGLVHVSDISWTHRVTRPGDSLTKSQEVELMVLSVDPAAQKISLGIKQLTNDPWDQLTKELMTGLQVTGKISRVVNFGLFVELENGLEGLVHVSEIPGMSSQSVEKNFSVGESISVSILHIDHESRKIALTCKNEPVSASDVRS